MILIVEDHPENAELFRLYLERKGSFKTQLSIDGDEIVELCRSGKVSLVLMDIQLHNTMLGGKPHSGIDLSKVLKTDEKTKDIPILLATAHAMREQKEAFLSETGAEGYIAKPVHDFDALIAQIRKCLESKVLQKRLRS